MTDLAKLKELAEAATPGMWRQVFDDQCEVDTVRSVDGDFVLADDLLARDAAFIAAANPATILALISRLEEAEGQLLDRTDKATAWDAVAEKNERIATLTAQRDEAVGALEKSIKDTGFLISVINGVRAATGEGPEEEDAAIFWQINHDYASGHAQDVVARIKGG